MKFIGIDGCRAGWFYVGFDHNNAWQIGIIEKISDFAEHLRAADLTLIDIPIGLKSNGKEERRCDLEARQRLKPKRSASVFPVPCRASLQASNYQQASEINLQETGRKLSRQTWNIMPKIKQVDDFLLAEENSFNLKEMHPELCFWSLNQRQAMSHNKKTEHGFIERKRLLNQYCQDTADIFKQARSCFTKIHLADDDILDALVGAVVARFHGNLASLPETPQHDDLNLSMEVVFPCLNQDTAVIKTPAGFMRLDAKDDELIRVQWLMETNTEKYPNSLFLKNVVRQIEQYWHDPNNKLSVEKKYQGTDFMNRVWQLLEMIPVGETCTYGKLAKKLNSSARAVGNACRKNPYPLLIPCHRVISASGVGGYDGETIGRKLQIKRALLRHEGNVIPEQ